MNCIWTIWADCDLDNRGIPADVTTFHLIHRPQLFPAVAEPTQSVLDARVWNNNAERIGKAVERLIEAME
jgi:hypothetical protein